MLDATQKILNIVNEVVADAIAIPVAGLPFIYSSFNHEGRVGRLGPDFQKLFVLLESVAIPLLVTTALGKVGLNVGINLAQGFNPFANPTVTLLNTAITCGVAGAVGRAIFGPRSITPVTHGGSWAVPLKMTVVQRLSDIIGFGIATAIQGSVVYGTGKALCVIPKAITALVTTLAEPASGIAL